MSNNEKTIAITGATDSINGAMLTNQSHLTDSHVQLRGTGTPGDVIAIYKDLPSRPDGSSLPEGTHASVTVQADGTWSFDTVLSENRNYYTAVSTSTGEYSGNPFNLYLDSSPVHAKVSISGAIDLDNGASLSNQSHLTDSHVQLRGTGTPGDVIAIYKDLPSRPDGSSLPEGTHANVVVQADGTWSFDTALSENRNYYTAVSTSTGEYSGNPFNLYLDPGLKVSATGDHQILHLDSVAGQTAASVHASADVHQSTPKVSLTDVLDLGEKDLFPHSSQLPVAITCQQGNAVELPNTHVADGAWLQHGAAVVSGVTHNVFENSGAHVDLLVQQSVATVLHQ